MKRIYAILSALVISATLWAASYVQLVSTDQLEAGDTLVWVNKAKLKGNTTISSNSKYMQVTDVQLVGADTIVSSDLTPMVLGGSTGAWTFTYTDGKKIGRVNNSTNFSTTANLTYTISFTADSNAIICSASASTYRIFYNISSPRFAFYTSSTMSSVQLFKKLPEGQGADVKVSDVQLNIDTLYLRAGEQDVLTATVLPADAKNKEVEWGSLNEGVATVNKGVVSAIAQGETKVWVRTVDGGFTDTCFVKIYASIDQPDVTWNQLQSLDSLKEGTRVFFASVKAGKNYVMGIYDYATAKSNIRGAAATFSDDRHQVTASQSYAYTVHIDNGKYVFTDLDGSYLCDYNLKNLSAQDNLDNKARWTGAVTKDFAFTFTNVYNTGYVIYNNHNSDMFCCYNAYDQSNMSYIAIYSDNAPEWKEPELHPEWTILCNK
ncbi:MAG: Ig domain-containing protein, partial [Bacteroidales bacterium]|nr:Ig domain-containing protein [Bacteroidales bacterium]